MYYHLRIFIYGILFEGGIIWHTKNEQTKNNIITAVEIRNYMNFFMLYKSMNKFYYELCKDHVMLDWNLIKETGGNFYHILNDTYQLNISESMIKIISISYAATEDEIKNSIVIVEKLDYDAIVTYWTH